MLSRRSQCEETFYAHGAASPWRVRRVSGDTRRMFERWLMERVSPTGRTMYYVGLVVWVIFAVASIFLFGWTQGMSRGTVKIVFVLASLVWTFVWGGLCALLWPKVPEGQGRP